MSDTRQEISARMTVGIDLGDRYSEFCLVDSDGTVVDDGRLRTTQAALRRYFGERAPMLGMIETLSSEIRAADRRIEQLANERYPETKRLRQIAGVGPITSLCFVLTLEDPSRFPNSRSVGGHLGMCPRRRDSGGHSPQLRINKGGDSMLRRLLVNSAHYILGPFGPDRDLRIWGFNLAERGGKNAKKRAVVAVARRLACMLHSIWLNDTEYEPLRLEQRRTAA